MDEAAIPVVFQCRTCSAILGDSMSLLHFSEEKGTITLQCVVNIQRCTVPIYSSDKADAGNTYHELMCRQCKRILGKWYSATLPQFDEYRMMYTLNTNDLVEYSVGLDAPMEQWNMEGSIAVNDWKSNIETMNDLMKRLERAKKVANVVEVRLVDSERKIQALNKGTKRARHHEQPQTRSK